MKVAEEYCLVITPVVANQVPVFWSSDLNWSAFYLHSVPTCAKLDVPTRDCTVSVLYKDSLRTLQQTELCPIERPLS